MNWERVLPYAALRPGMKKTVRVGGKDILLINHCDKVFAISTSCPHWGLPLEPGRLTDDCGLICPWHRSAFDLQTGDVKAWAPWLPGLGRVIGATSRRKALPTYATRLEDEHI
jgi:nitrite reductase/ring-hydroxylating ferredoxin subunit